MVAVLAPHPHSCRPSAGWGPMSGAACSSASRCRPSTAGRTALGVGDAVAVVVECAGCPGSASTSWTRRSRPGTCHPQAGAQDRLASRAARAVLDVGAGEVHHLAGVPERGAVGGVEPPVVALEHAPPVPVDVAGRRGGVAPHEVGGEDTPAARSSDSASATATGGAPSCSWWGWPGITATLKRASLAIHGVGVQLAPVPRQAHVGRHVRKSGAPRCSRPASVQFPRPPIGRREVVPRPAPRAGRARNTELHGRTQSGQVRRRGYASCSPSWGDFTTALFGSGVRDCEARSCNARVGGQSAWWGHHTPTQVEPL